MDTLAPRPMLGFCDVVGCGGHQHRPVLCHSVLVKEMTYAQGYTRAGAGRGLGQGQWAQGHHDCWHLQEAGEAQMDF